MAIQWPLVVDRLVAWLPTLPAFAGVTVFDGPAYDVGSAAATFVTVGHSDDGQTTRSGTWSTDLAIDGYRYVETGDVACALFYEVDADSTMSALRSTVFPLLDAIDDGIRADKRLGVLAPEGLAWLTADIAAAQIVAGSMMSVPFSINYQTTT